MTENYESAIETSPAYCNTEKNIIYISSSSSSSSSSSEKDEDNGSPIRHIRCVKSYEDVKLFEETDDCFILDFDPSNPLQLSKLTLSAFDSSPSDTTTDLVLIAEKGQVACRDYPHPRHLCLKHPFETAPHESFCELCFCYVCDSNAPCQFWTEPKPAHCHASEHDKDWKSKRHSMKRNC